MALQAGDPLGEVRGKALAALEVGEEVRGQRSVVHVGAGDHPRRGDHLARVATIHDQRDPLAELVPVFRVFHPPIEVMPGECGMSFLEEGDVVGALHEAHVRDGMDEGFRRPYGAGLYEVRPELPREVELDIDLERLRDVDAPIAARRGVVQLAERGVARTGVVPGARAFLGLLLQDFEHLDSEVGLKLLQHDPQGGAHDAGADQNDVHLVRAVRVDGSIRYGPLVHSTSMRLHGCNRRAATGAVRPGGVDWE